MWVDLQFIRSEEIGEPVAVDDPRWACFREQLIHEIECLFPFQRVTVASWGNRRESKLYRRTVTVWYTQARGRYSIRYDQERAESDRTAASIQALVDRVRCCGEWRTLNGT